MVLYYMNMLLVEDFQINELKQILALPLDRLIKHLKWSSDSSTLQGKRIWIGLKDGWLASADVIKIEKNMVQLSINCKKKPPPPLPVMLILAIPRPKALRRALISAITLGVKRIWLINSARVEKSYWQTPLLEDERLKSIAVEALEQARDSVMPEIKTARLFKPFMEDMLPAILQEYPVRLFATPDARNTFPELQASPAALAVGPEEGFTSYEQEKFREHLFFPAALGKRILRVETAVSALIARVSVAYEKR
jgi:RsmE family RNA methyltransferase